jgi:hypothetical protein
MSDMKRREFITLLGGARAVASPRAGAYVIAGRRWGGLERECCTKHPRVDRPARSSARHSLSVATPWVPRPPVQRGVLRRGDDQPNMTASPDKRSLLPPANILPGARSQLSGRLRSRVTKMVAARSVISGSLRIWRRAHPSRSARARPAR